MRVMPDQGTLKHSVANRHPSRPPALLMCTHPVGSGEASRSRVPAPPAPSPLSTILSPWQRHRLRELSGSSSELRK